MHVFNRSHYEDVLITRVVGLINDATAEQRFAAINNFEQLLQQSGTKVLKFYLNVSEQEQQERLQERVDDPDKQWKYEPGDADKAKQCPPTAASTRMYSVTPARPIAPGISCPPTRTGTRPTSSPKLCATR